MTDEIRIAAFAGSLRKGSFNKMLLRAAIEVAPPGVRIEPFEIADLPLFSSDLEDDEDPLPPVKRVWDAIRGADALLVVSPEYNYSVPAVTKNVLDWASRGDDVLEGKIGAVMGASNGRFGTVRMQQHIRNVGVGAGLGFIQEPEVMVTLAKEKFDADGRLTDERTRDQVRKLLEALAAAARAARSGRAG